MAETKTNAAADVKTVAVPEETLKSILSRMEDMEQTIKNQDATIGGLKEAQKEYEQTASQDQILKIEKLRASGKLVKAVRLNYYDNKLILRWQSTHDDVYVDNTGKEISLQKTKLTFADDTEIEIPQIDLARRKMQREYEVIKEGRTQDGKFMFTVLTEGGKEVEIDSNYVN